MKKAKAAVMAGYNVPFDVREFNITPPPAGMAEIELIASGVCGTDIHIHTGKLTVGLPTVIGHEFAGKVMELDEKEGKKYGISVGDNVIVCIAVPCGKCLLCKSGDDANCVNMGVTNGGDINSPPHLYGGYAEVNYSPVKNCIKIPKDVLPSAAAVFACPGPTAIHAFSLAKKAGIDFKDVNTAVVQGLGPVGCFAVMYLKALGIKNIVAVTNRNDKKRAELAKKLGATHVFSIAETSEAEVFENIKKLSGGLGADLAFEASGAPAAFTQGLEMLRNRGTYLVPGQYSNSGTVALAPQIITFKALRIIGSSQYSLCDVKDYLAFLSANPALQQVINTLKTEYKIEKINKAFEDAKAGKNIKTVLVK